MTGAIQLVFDAKVFPTLIRFELLKIRIEVPAIFLSLGNQVDDLLGPPFQRWIRVGLEGERGGLEPLGHIGVPEVMGLVKIAFAPRQFHGLDTPGFDIPPIADGEGPFAVYTLNLLPKPASQFNSLQVGCLHVDAFLFFASMPKFVVTVWEISLKLSDCQIIQEQDIFSKTHFSPPARSAP
jgi:hypothetical protein